MSLRLRSLVVTGLVLTGVVATVPPGHAATLTPAAPSLPAMADIVTVGGSSHLLNGTDVERAADSLVVYTPASGATSPANEWGVEVAVLSGRVIAIRDRQTTGAAAMPIPPRGFVLSAHGTARDWLLAHAATRAAVTRTTSACTGGFVRLTFDDGPDPAVTPQVLATLRSRGVTATFFVIGEKVKANGGLVRREAQLGNAVGNHTWDHPYMTTLSPAEQAAELRKTSRAIAATGAPTPTQWRPPYEDWNPAVRDLARTMGLTMVLWSYETDSNDWMGGTPEEITATVVSNAHDGDIVLMHDRIQNTATALPGVLDGLTARGLCVDPAPQAPRQQD